MVLIAAAGLRFIDLDDALAILVLTARARSAASTVPLAVGGPAVAERSLSLSDACYALALVERLPDCRDALHQLTRR